MSTFTKHLTIAAVAMLGLLFGAVRYVQAGVIEHPHKSACRDLPVVENLTGLFSDQTCDWMVESKEMTTGKVRKLAATARTSEDHLVIARFYRAQATSLDEDAAGYELAASNLRNGPEVKNFVAPATGARLEFAAKRFREEAKTERALAASHENMAKAALRR